MQIIKNLSVYRSLLGTLLLISNLVYFLCITFDSWEFTSQITFHFPILITLWVIFFKDLTISKIAILSWISFFVAEYAIIDDYLYLFLWKWKLFPSFVVHNNFVNPQYTKLLLYYLLLPILGILLTFKNQRTIDRVFTFIGTSACLLITFLIHDAIPNKTLGWERDLAKKNMGSLIQYITSSNLSNMTVLCESFEISCTLNLNINEIPPQARPINGQSSRVVEFGEFQGMMWKRQVLGVIKNSNSTYTLIKEDKLINKSQMISEETFGKVTTIANLIWGWGFLLLGIFHKISFRKKIFSKTTTTS